MKGFNAYDSLVRAEIFASVKISFNGASKGFADEKSIEGLVQENRPVVRQVIGGTIG